MKLAARALIVTIAASLLLGCATRPTGSPGSGYGSAYTPIVDMQGVDPARWAADLAECRSYARQVDTTGNAATGAMAGAVLGAALMAAAGGNRRWNSQAAGVGAVEGTAVGLAAGIRKERLVMNNCVVGRGYRVLDSNIAFVPQQMPIAVAPASSLIPAPIQQIAPPGVTNAQPVAVPAVYHQPESTPDLTIKQGKWARESERIASFLGCAVPIARLTLAEADFERYAISCGGGGGDEAMKVNCEKGRCSVQR